MFVSVDDPFSEKKLNWNMKFGMRWERNNGKKPVEYQKTRFSIFFFRSSKYSFRWKQSKYL